MPYPSLSWETDKKQNKNGMPSLSWENDPPKPILAKETTKPILPETKQPEATKPPAKQGLLNKLLSIGRNEEKIAKERESYDRLQANIKGGMNPLRAINTEIGESLKYMPFRAGLVKGATFAGKRPEGAPWTYTAGEIAGSLAPFGVAYKGAKLLTNGIAKSVPRIAATGALAGAPVGAVQGAVEGEDMKGIAKNALLYGAIGGTGDVAVEKAAIPLIKKGAELSAPYVKPVLSKIKDTVSKVLDKYKGKAVPVETIEREAAKEHWNLDWDNLNETQRAAIRRVVQNMQPEPVRSGRQLFPAQEFTMRDMTPQDKMLSVMGGRKPLALPEGTASSYEAPDKTRLYPKTPISETKKPVFAKGVYDSYQDNKVPAGWYVHGHKDKTALSKEYPTQLTQDWDIARQYAGDSGNMHMIKPKEKANVLDLSDYKEVDRLIKLAQDDYKNGELYFADWIESSLGKESLTDEDIATAIRESFAPDDIVNTAGAYDNMDFVQWLKERINPDFVVTPDGAVTLNPNAVKNVIVSKEGNIIKNINKGAKIGKRNTELQPLQFKTQIPKASLNQPTTPPLNFKQTIEVPKVYDKHAFTGETRPLSKLDQLMMKENAGTNQAMAKQVSKIDQPAKIETVEEILRTIMPGKLKDISGPQSYFTDAYRNFHKVFGKDYDRVKRAVLDPFDKAKGENARFQESWLNKLQTEIVSDKTGLGIKKGSKLSALVQKYGEGTITEAELSSLTEAELNKIKTADAWFRKAYDELLDRVNLVRRQIYPTNPDKIIPKRQDYYRHFKEITNDIQGLKNIFDTPAQIDPKLEGISEYTKPKTAWKSWAQRRFGGMDYTNDAVGGFLGYLPSASYGIHIDPHISKFSGLAKQMAEKTGATKDTNNFIRFLNQYSQDLAGKTNPLDRRIQEMVGRGAFRAVSWLNSRVKANVILGNLGSSLAQLGNIPQGIAHAKQHSLNGFLRTIRSLYEPNKAIAQSDFIKERFLDKLYRQFDTDLLSKPRNLAVWLMESMDKAGTHFIWNSAHEKAIKEGIKNPIKYADDVTRDMVAGRGIGEVPIGQKSKMMQTLIPFTLEVSNLWKVQKDMLNKKDMVGLLLLYASCFGFNEAMEKIRGSRVTFDPIDALREAITDDELTGFRRAGRLVGEVISNVPGGQFAAQLYPEYGAQIGDAKLPSRRELFGSNDPSRYGPGMISVKGLQDPLTHVLTPFGGMQISKTLKGVDALRNRGVYTEKPTLLTYGQELLTGEPQPRTKLKYPVDTDLKNTAGGLMFGIGGLKETRPYYDNNRRPLSENQTKDLKRQEAKGRNVKALYEAKMAERRIDTLETKLKEVNKLNLTTEEKALERARLRQEIKKYKELRNQFLQKK